MSFSPNIKLVFPKILRVLAVYLAIHRSVPEIYTNLHQADHDLQAEAGFLFLLA